MTSKNLLSAGYSLIELVVAGLFINFWGGATYPQPWIQLSLYGEEITTSANSSPNFNRGATQPIILWDFAQEPRVAFDNSPAGASLFARDPWSNFYEANAAATDMPRLIKERKLVIRDPATGALPVAAAADPASVGPPARA